jgi:hypothetical protein
MTACPLTAQMSQARLRVWSLSRFVAKTLSGCGLNTMLTSMS